MLCNMVCYICAWAMLLEVPAHTGCCFPLLPRATYGVDQQLPPHNGSWASLDFRKLFRTQRHSSVQVKKMLVCLLLTTLDGLCIFGKGKYMLGGSSC